MIYRFAKQSYWCLPDTLRRPLDPWRHKLIALRDLQRDLWLIEGVEQSTGLPLAIACAIPEPHRRDLLERIYGHSFHQRRLGRHWHWNLGRVVRRRAAQCGLQIVYGPRYPQRPAPGGGLFFIPAWLEGQAMLPFPREIARTRSFKEECRTIRRSGYAYKITQDPEQMDWFLRELLLPYACGVYGARTLPAYNLAEQRQLHRGCELLLVQDTTQVVAGMSFRSCGDNSSVFGLGVRQPTRTHIRNGAATAAYYFTLQHLATLGCTNVGLGLSRPFLRDGVLGYKRTWGQRIQGASVKGYHLSVRHDSTAVRGFLKSNPFAYLDGTEITGAVFVDADSPPGPPELSQLQKEFLYPGLAQLRIFRLHAGSAPRPDSVSPDGFPQLRIDTLPLPTG